MSHSEFFSSPLGLPVARVIFHVKGNVGKMEYVKVTRLCRNKYMMAAKCFGKRPLEMWPSECNCRTLLPLPTQGEFICGIKGPMRALPQDRLSRSRCEALHPPPRSPLHLARNTRRLSPHQTAAIGSSMHIKGDIRTNEELLVDGEVEGSLESTAC